MRRILLLSLFSVFLFSCKSQQYTLNDLPESQLIFGSGGGITGSIDGVCNRAGVAIRPCRPRPPVAGGRRRGYPPTTGSRSAIVRPVRAWTACARLSQAQHAYGLRVGRGRTDLLPTPWPHLGAHAKEEARINAGYLPFGHRHGA